MKQQLISLAESKALRGIAILGIILHNYCHFLPAVQENEYTFEEKWPNMLLNSVITLGHNCVIDFLSFFGCYGVPVFLFVSGYGLVMKYENDKAEKIRPLSFIGYHYLKLFRLMFLGYIAFVVVCFLHPNGYHGYSFGNIVAQMLMYINVLPSPDKIIKPGPYWFFGLMIQLYIVYRLFLYRRHWAYTVCMVVFCWLIQEFCDPAGETINRIRYNFFGGMLPFGAGILFARYGKEMSRLTYAAIMLVSLFLICVSSFNFHAWLWTPLFIVSATLGIVKILPLILMKVFVWFGAISAALFVAHPITREIIIPMSYHGMVWTGIIIYLISSIALAWLFKYIFRYIPKPKLK